MRAGYTDSENARGIWETPEDQSNIHTSDAIKSPSMANGGDQAMSMRYVVRKGGRVPIATGDGFARAENVKSNQMGRS